MSLQIKATLLKKRNRKTYSAPGALCAKQPTNMGKKRRTQPFDLNKDVDCLYNSILRSNKLGLRLATEWLDSYQNCRGTALLKLSQLIFDASGFKSRIPRKFMPPFDFQSLASEMIQTCDGIAHEYPLVRIGLQWTKFQSEYARFLQYLIKNSDLEMFRDDFFVPNMIGLVEYLAKSKVRALRHTATYTGLKLVSALLEVHFEIKGTNDSATGAGGTNNGGEGAVGIGAEVLNCAFKAVVPRGCCDTVAVIRNICIAEMGIWMKTYPGHFVDELFLKYLGTALYDKTGEVRMDCIQTLIPLYLNPELKVKLENFTSLHKKRFLQLPHDIEYEVGIVALKLFSKIWKMFPGFVTYADIDDIVKLVFCEHHEIGVLAADILIEQLEQRLINLVSNSQSKINEFLLMGLVRFFLGADVHEHAVYFVDSFLERHECIRDWPSMTRILLTKSNAGDGVNVTPAERKCLIEIMVCAMKQLTSDEAPAGRISNTLKTAGVKDTVRMQESKRCITTHFIDCITKLITKFGRVKNILCNLLRIVTLFDPTTLLELNAHEKVNCVLEELRLIMLSNNNKEVLWSAVEALNNLCCEGFSTFVSGDRVRNGIVDQLIHRFKANYRSANYSDPTVFNQTMHSLLCIFSYWNLNDRKLFPIFMAAIIKTKNVGNPQDNSCPPTGSVVAMVKMCGLSLQWCHYEQLNKPKNAKAQRQLKRDFKQYLNACTELLSGSASSSIKKAFFLTVSDLLVLLAEGSKGNEKQRHSKTVSCIVHSLASAGVADAAAMQALKTNGFGANTRQEIALINYVEHVVNNEHIPEEERREVLVSYCKLIVFNILTLRNSIFLFKNYIKHIAEYGDILKITLEKAREINKINLAVVLVLTLIFVYKDLELKSSGSRVDETSTGFSELKQLVKVFGQVFVVENADNHEPLKVMHRGGILFAGSVNSTDPLAPPARLSFLCGLECIVNLLNKDDKTEIIEFLDRAIAPALPSSSTKEWQPLLSYRSALFGSRSNIPPNVNTVDRQPNRSGMDDLERMFNDLDEIDSTRRESKNMKMDLYTGGTGGNSICFF